MKRKGMDSRELGLVLGTQLFDLQDLHFGLWDGLETNTDNVHRAQQQYTDFLLAALPPPTSDNGTVSVLDIGCGTGTIMEQMLKRGYQADGVIPSAFLHERARKRLADFMPDRCKFFECRLEDFPVDRRRKQYDIALFSESFQYIRMEQSFAILPQLIKDGGLVVICDFFKSEAHGDGGVGDHTMGGGHHVRDFFAILDDQPFQILRDEDITNRASPTMTVADNVLMNKVKPACDLITQYALGRHPWITRIGMRLFRKHIEKADRKYFSGMRNNKVFERYKTYRLIVLKHEPGRERTSGNVGAAV